ncbi:hypothetical protein Zmor_010896 [Zophobas morio]|uniref:Peptidase A2 domain-containing protein n=1 Tax=Zophobas morio TaxID=2755281 RepID=A0AA38MJ57_9CUCU|nr:hypothetical protein Zmor_010896 [Zophobas morio]
MPGKINGTPIAITIDTSAEVSIIRLALVTAKVLATSSETIRLNTVSGESAPIMGQAEVEIDIGQLKISHRALVAGMEDDFILGMDLISRHGLTVDPVEKVLRLGNEEFTLNQRSIESKPVRLITCQNMKVREFQLEQKSNPDWPSALFNHQKESHDC